MGQSDNAAAMRMIDEDVRNIAAILQKLPADAEPGLKAVGILISVGELASVFRDAIAYRASLPAPDPLRQAAKEVAPHAGAWLALLSEHVETLPEDGLDGSGDSARSYAEHELRAMRRDLGALGQALLVTA